MSYYIIRTRCPNGCKYKIGNKCSVSECPYQTGNVRYDIRMNAEDKPTKINAQVKQAVKEFAEHLKKYAIKTNSAAWGLIEFVEVSDIDRLLDYYMRRKNK